MCILARRPVLHLSMRYVSVDNDRRLALVRAPNPIYEPETTLQTANPLTLSA